MSQVEAAVAELARLQALKLTAEEKRNGLRHQLGLLPLSSPNVTPPSTTTTAPPAEGSTPATALPAPSTGAPAAVTTPASAAGNAVASNGSSVEKPAAVEPPEASLSAVEQHQIRCAQQLGIVHVLESLLLRPPLHEVSASDLTPSY